MENFNILNDDHSINIDELEKFLYEIFFNKRERNRKVIIMQGCLDQGAVTRDDCNLNLCSNPKCSSCNMFHKLLAEEAGSFIKEQNNENKNN